MRVKIKSKILITSIILLSAAFFATASYCAEESKLSDKDKIIGIFKEREFVPSKVKSNDAVCAGLVAALRENKGYEFVEPLVQTDDYKDSNLQSYIGKCPKLELNREFQIEPRMLQYMKGLTPKEQEEYGLESRSDGDFKLYRIAEIKAPYYYIFYAGKWHNTLSSRIIYSDSNYSIVNLNKCRNEHGITVAKTINDTTGQPTGHFNGVIQYKDHYFVFSMRYFPKELLYGLSIYKVSKSVVKTKKSHSVIYDENGVAPPRKIVGLPLAPRDYILAFICSYSLKEKGVSK